MATPVPALPSMSPQLIQIILDGPGASAPQGITPNFDNPPITMRMYFIPTVVLTTVFATVTLAARLYTKTFIIRSIGWEDVCVFMGWAFFIAYIVLCIICFPYAGVHMWNVQVKNVFLLLYYSNIVEILYTVAITFIKISILLQYRRIFVPTRRTTPAMFYGIWAVFWLTIVFYLLIMLVKVFSCTPRELIWNKLLSGSCLNVDAILVVSAAFNLASDIVILALPQYSIWRLQMANKQKLSLSALFGMGGLACIVTALRVYTCVQLVQMQNDYTWYIGPTAMWCVAELSLGVMCSCLPMMPKFFRAIGGQLSRLSTSKSSYRNSDFRYDHCPTASYLKEKARVLDPEGAKAPPKAETWYDEGLDIEAGRALDLENSDEPAAINRLRYSDQPEELTRMAEASESDDTRHRPRSNPPTQPTHDRTGLESLSTTEKGGTSRVLDGERPVWHPDTIPLHPADGPRCPPRSIPRESLDKPLPVLRPPRDRTEDAVEQDQILRTVEISVRQSSLRSERAPRHVAECVWRRSV